MMEKLRTYFLILLLLRKVEYIMAQLETLTADVEANTSVTDSAVTLLENLAAEIRANVTDQAALNDLASRLESNSAKLADAVTANTPAEE